MLSILIYKSWGIKLLRFFSQWAHSAYYWQFQQLQNPLPHNLHEIVFQLNRQCHIHVHRLTYELEPQPKTPHILIQQNRICSHKTTMKHIAIQKVGQNKTNELELFFNKFSQNQPYPINQSFLLKLPILWMFSFLKSLAQHNCHRIPTITPTHFNTQITIDCWWNL